MARLGRLEAEDANLLSALDWLVERGDAPAATRLAASLWPFWYMRNSYREGMDRLERVLAVPGDRSGERYATVLLGAGFIATSRGDYAGARNWHEASLAVSVAEADPIGQGWALFGLGEVARFSGDDDAAVIHLEDALRLLRPAGVASWLIGVLNGLGDARRRRGELELAAACLDEALALARQTGDRWSGDQTRNMAARVAYDQGDMGRAAELWLESLTNFSEARDFWNIAWCLAGLGATSAMQGQAERAVRLFGASEALQEAIGGAITSRPNWPHAAVARARRDLGEAGFAAAWAAGRALPPEAAIAEASARAAPALAPAAAKRAPDHLQRLPAREQDVLRLLVEHRTNREIGAALFLSPRTVAWHVSAICAKFGVATRREASAVAIERGLV